MGESRRLKLMIAVDSLASQSRAAAPAVMWQSMCLNMRDLEAVKAQKQ